MLRKLIYYFNIIGLLVCIACLGFSACSGDGMPYVGVEWEAGLTDATGTIPAEGLQTRLNISLDGDYNVKWQITVPDWIDCERSGVAHRGTNEVPITISANNTNATRSGTLEIHMAGETKTISLTQLSRRQPIVSPTKLYFKAEGGGPQSVTVNYNGTWSVSCDASWLEVQKTSTGIDVYAAENIEDDARSATIVITADGQPVEINVTQEGAIDPNPTVLSADPLSISFPTAGGTESITLKANEAWQLAAKPDWITSVSPSEGGTGRKAVYITAAPNPNAETRTGIVSFTTTGEQSYTCNVEVRQGGTAPYLNITPTTCNTIPSEGDTRKFTVDTNVSTYEATVNQSWITVTKNGKEVTIKVAANTSTTERYGKLTVSATGCNPVSVDITQAGATPQTDPSITCPNVSGTIVFDAKGGTPTTINVVANVSWKIQSKPAWINVSGQTSGTNNSQPRSDERYSFTATATENTTTDERSGQIILQAIDYPDCKFTINVRQMAQSSVDRDDYDPEQDLDQSSSQQDVFSLGDGTTSTKTFNDVPAAGTTMMVQVKCSGGWQATSNYAGACSLGLTDTNATAKTITHSGNANLYLNVSANTSTSPRTATVTIEHTPQGGTKKTITLIVNQLAAEGSSFDREGYDDDKQI